MILSAYRQQLQHRKPWHWYGGVTQVVGQTIESEGPPCSINDCCEIVDSDGNSHLAEVIGFRGNTVLSMPLEDAKGIRFGDKVVALGQPAAIAVSSRWLGRVMDGNGRPIDDKPAPPVEGWAPLMQRPIAPMQRLPIQEPLSTGIKAIDGMLTTGVGQRIGIFGGSGVGKSTLIGMMTRNAAADVIVIGLIGERGREVPEFLRDSLGEEGMQRAVTVVSTSDESPLMRMRGALAATAIAESFAKTGKRVLLVLDSLTRYAMAAREVGLAAGEPPVSKGYTPSVFSKLAQLVERAGNFQIGSITAFYTVLMEGDDQQDPIVDSVRSLLDGHVVLSRTMASEGSYPPIDILDSLSRLMPSIVSRQHQARAIEIRRLMGTYARSSDMVRIGAYKPGTDVELDKALRCHPVFREFFTQNSSESFQLNETRDKMLALPIHV